MGRDGADGADGAAAAFGEFVAVIRALRTPGTGCPWDLEQDHGSLKPYLVEEAYEVLDAIDAADDAGLREELGDLLLQVVLHAQVGADRGAFSITEVVRDITAKMVRRHPHVFGAVEVSGSAEVVRNWEAIKAAESPHKQAAAGVLAGVPNGLPALHRAQRLGARAAKAGLDWDALAGVLAKVHEEMAELEAEVERAGERPAPPRQHDLPGEVRDRLAHELGDTLFSLCQLARWLGLDAEDCLRACATRFTERFHRLERQVNEPLSELSPAERAEAWERAKRDDEPG